ncbi:putative MFS family arabinose efflux permease [Haloactinospora alba]|uniref:Putative MFS family arabinose efflux permease n=1 Tax=Haloactinospora alba TaxID=405555 RepID=A0A543N723_9ACTN|nr:MFS transporter [Haloactinospora alba]TQN27628.1 putative MFS family arabinose efflux permease [Haloactinospora alba]
MPPTPAFRHFVWLTAGYSVSSFGTYLNMVALGLFVYQLTGRALDTGLFLAIRLLTSLVTAPAIGGLANRVNRRVAMVGADTVQGSALVAFVLAPSPWQEILAYALAVLLGAGASVSNVLLRSSVPALVGAEQRVRANGYLVTGRSTAMTLGFASAGAIVAFVGYEVAFLVDAATFLVSAVILAAVPLRFPRPGESAPEGDGQPAQPDRTGFWRAQRAAVRTVAAVPVLAFMLVVRGMDAFGSASHNIGIPIFASLEYPENPAWFVSGFWTAWAVGSLSAYRLFGRTIAAGGDTSGERGFVLGTGLMSVFFILAFTGLPLYALVAVAACAGLADGYTEIAYNSRLQTVPERERGTVFGVSHLLETGGLGVGMLISSALLELWAPLPVVGAAHGLAIASALVFLIAFPLTRERKEKTRKRDGESASDSSAKEQGETG